MRRSIILITVLLARRSCEGRKMILAKGRGGLAAAFLVCVCLGGVKAVRAQQWSILVPSTGTFGNLPRFGHSAVYNPTSNDMVVFGGVLTSSAFGPQPNPNGAAFANLNDVWVLSYANGLGGTPNWTNLIANGASGSPVARHWQAVVYDQTNNRMIVFGGCSVACLPALNDVWVLVNADGSTGSPSWEQLSPTGGPPSPRVAPAAVYDPGTNSMIIFGGQDGSGNGGSTFSDTWVLSNANGMGGTPTWTQLSPTGGPPPGQNAPSAVYDSTNNIMIVMGGGAQGTGAATNAVWALSHANGQGGTPTWTNLVAEGATGSPPARTLHTAIYNPSTNRMAIFGGVTSPSTSFNDTWVLSNANGLSGTPAWTQLNPPPELPAQRDSHSAVYDDTNDRMIVFGGAGPEGYFYSTWVISPATVPGGGGSAPSADLSPATLSFTGEVVGETSQAQAVTLMNNGTAALTVDSVTISGDFSQTNNCGSSVSAGAACTISVTFKPTAAGSATGALTIADTAPGSPQSVAISGTGQDFSISAASGSSTSASVSPGASASYNIAVTPLGGFNQAVVLSCTGAPTLATCSANPASVTPNGTSASTVTVTVTTTAGSMIAPGRLYEPPSSGGERTLWYLVWSLLAFGILTALVRVRRRRLPLAIGLMVLLVVFFAGCGGSGGAGGGGGSPGTPSGTYSLTVTGTLMSGSSTLSHSVTLSLTVD